MDPRGCMKHSDSVFSAIRRFWTLSPVLMSLLLWAPSSSWSSQNWNPTQTLNSSRLSWSFYCRYMGTPSCSSQICSTKHRMCKGCWPKDGPGLTSWCRAHVACLAFSEICKHSSFCNQFVLRVCLLGQYLNWSKVCALHCIYNVFPVVCCYDRNESRFAFNMAMPA